MPALRSRTLPERPSAPLQLAEPLLHRCGLVRHRLLLKVFQDAVVVRALAGIESNVLTSSSSKWHRSKYLRNAGLRHSPASNIFHKGDPATETMPSAL